MRWAEHANVGYFAQDHVADFDSDLNLTDWMRQWTRPGDDEQVIRGILGRLLFSGDDVKKSVRVLSGGEQGRMLYGKLMLGRHNVLVMDEPTNHMDMESIESLNLALDLFKGTLIFVSHDRQFVGSLATRIIEMTPAGAGAVSGHVRRVPAQQGRGVTPLRSAGRSLRVLRKGRCAAAGHPPAYPLRVLMWSALPSAAPVKFGDSLYGSGGVGE